MIKRKRLQWGIRHFIVGWVGVVVIAFLLLCGGLLYAIASQHSKTARIFDGSKSLELNSAFEAAIVAEGRQDLLWRSTGDVRYLIDKERMLREADSLLRQLQARSDSETESRLLSDIENRYSNFKRTFLQTATRDITPAQEALNAVLEPLHRHHLLNQQQMNATMSDANRIDRLVDRLAGGLIAAATLLVIAGGIELWRRIFQPALSLAQAAREFSTDISVRAPVLRQDEMGMLAGTFNSMADSIGDREKERLHFVATVAHDLKNPLVVIGGAAHLLKSKDARLGPEDRERWLGTVEKNAHAMESLIQDLTDGVQAQTGALEFDIQPLNLAALVRDIAVEYSSTLETHLLRHEIIPSCPIQGDRKRLERILMNLLSNAVKYSPKGREVFVSLECDGAFALLRVCDEGHGIAQEDLPKLFLPFTRLERTKKMASGTGLGLSSVKKIIEGHGGVISVTSEPGVGSRFEVKLPIAPAEDPQ